MAIDDNTTYGLTGAQIKELPAKIDAVKGMARVLTADDYNYPTDNPDGVAVWKLEPGIYTINASSTNSVKIYFAKTNDTETYTYPGAFIVENIGNMTRCLKVTSEVSAPYMITACSTADGTYQENIYQYLLSRRSVRNNLTSTDTDRPLSANQGKVLNEKIEERIVQNAGAPTTSTVGTVGQLYQDTTNGKLYICTDATNPYVWEEVGAGGGGSGAMELTSVDYNWPTANADGVALWLLEPGMYYTEGAQVYMSSNQIGDVTNHGTFIVGDSFGASPAKLILYYDQNAPTAYLISTVISSGVRSSKTSLSSPTVVQTTGTSIDSVMSQNAVTSMVYADPATMEKIRIGAGASSSEGSDAIEIGHNSTAIGAFSIAIGRQAETLTAGNGSIALGHGTQANNGAIAIGRGTQNTVAGTVSFQDTNWGTSGYGGTGYRLLTGLYDGQSAHDAATVGQITPLSDSSAPTTATVGRLGQIFVDSTNTDAYMCVAVDDVTPSYTWKKITA